MNDDDKEKGKRKINDINDDKDKDMKIICGKKKRDEKNVKENKGMIGKVFASKDIRYKENNIDDDVKIWEAKARPNDNNLRQKHDDTTEPRSFNLGKSKNTWNIPTNL